MRVTARGAAALAAAILTVGCGDTAGLATGGGVNADVTVSAGAAPSYTWTGSNARRLTVTRVGGGVVWDIQSLDALGFASPVAHAVVPAGAEAVVAGQILEADVRYRVLVDRVTGADASAEFVP